jgi:pyruvate dehydrogenase E1 component alpha subunit
MNISYVQILDEKGNVDKTLEPQISESDLIRLYRSMLISRAADQKMLNMQRQGRIGTFAPCVGQEAVSAGATLAMKDTDWFVGAFREMPGRYLRGEPIANAFLTWNGFEEGYTFEKGTRTLPISIVIASQLPIAVGLTYAMRMKGEKETVAVVFFGDGATSEGNFHETLNFASVWQVPVIFICQNNGWAISTPISKQTHSRTIAQKALAYDMPGVQVDGNDVLAMFSATKTACDRARSGGGPTLIEAVTYRLWMHTTADDPSRYRTDEEVKEWEKRDPIPRFKKYLESKGYLNEQNQKELEESINIEINQAVEKFESMKDFKPDAPFDYIFANRPYEIEKQRADFLENLRRDNENG